GVVARDLAFEVVFEHGFGRPVQWIAEAASAGLLVDDDGVLKDAGGDLAGEWPALAGHLDVVARAAPRFSAGKAIRRETDAVGAHLQQRLGGEDSIGPPDADAAAIAAGAAAIGHEGILLD